VWAVRHRLPDRLIADDGDAAHPGDDPDTGDLAIRWRRARLWGIGGGIELLELERGLLGG